ncbi:DNA topoisomerase [Suillus subaureus]|uniref:DNA topoisomerase n=1 Tax=Suillus subaureus TaxID=48587 RepID=A0A9P7E6T0_9AGAM|nr:DNA topoisomerase [Suillus subaureus]KAG1812148.1 DNA topoisomerase [Suillus subaureus]
MRVLCVAEKPSIARSISSILSGGHLETRPTSNRFIKNFDFDYPQTNSQFTVTAVSGHLLAHDFPEEYRQWNSCDPITLFDAPIHSSVPADSKSIERNLLTEARRADTLMIWTDCDREGENIGSEIVKVCRKSHPQIVVKRARFSAIIPQQIHRAAQHPVDLDMAQAHAVEARIFLDLRIGAAFTRMQTLTLQTRLAQFRENREVVSYGPCQFPTLGFVVQRYNQVKSFVPEDFWYISFSVDRDDKKVDFNWKRGHLFESDVVAEIYEEVLQSPTARVVKVTQKDVKKYKPLPLTTVELQKAGSRLLRLAPKKVLDIAEKLYQQGFLSYPRTETDQYDPQFNFMTLIEKQTADPAWGGFATGLHEGNFNTPRRGKNNDKAHPPIHPTAHAGNLAGDEKKVYEFITRRFLASCSKDAEGKETIVQVDYGGEEFNATGLIVLQRNYLEVYPYDKWSAKEIPNFQEGERFVPSVCEIKDGQTSSPSLLTEADLVTLMDKNGIGTDATIAQHIQTIIDREYVIERMDGATKHLTPSTLGIGLIEGYNEIGFERSLSKPQLRRETERGMVRVCEGTKSKAEMLTESIEQYREMYVLAKREFDKVVSSVRRYIERNAGANQGGGGGGGRGRGRGPGAGRGAGRRNNDDNDDDNDNGGPPPGGASRGRGRGRGRPRGTAAPASRGRGRGAARAAPAPPSNDIDDLNDDMPPPAPPPRGRSRASNGLSKPSAPVSRTTSSGGKPTSSKVITPIATPRPNPLPSSSMTPECECGVPSQRKTVTQKSAREGKEFYACGVGDGCGFFKWCDDGPVGMSANPMSLVPAKRALASERSLNQVDAVARQCQCREDAARRTVIKEGPNKGRIFWGCSKGKDGGCEFFEWDDESSKPKSAAAPRPMSSRSVTQNDSTSSSGKCFKCDQEGHWASACPNGDMTSRSKPASQARGSASGDACFKCGQTGHWTSECPGNVGPGPSKRAKSTSRASKSSSNTTSRGRGGKRGGKKGAFKTKGGTFGAPDDF